MRRSTPAEPVRILLCRTVVTNAPIPQTAVDGVCYPLQISRTGDGMLGRSAHGRGRVMLHSNKQNGKTTGIGVANRLKPSSLAMTVHLPVEDLDDVGVGLRIAFSF